MLSQFGLIWLFAAAPVVAILRDVTRYLAGRLGDPPAPANVLPGERPPDSASAVQRRAPSVYQPAQAPPMTATRPAPAPQAIAPTPERSAAS